MIEIVLDRTRRDYDEVAELYDDLVRRGDQVTDALSTAMIDAFADLVAPAVLRVTCWTPAAALSSGPTISIEPPFASTGSTCRRR